MGFSAERPGSSALTNHHLLNTGKFGGPPRLTFFLKEHKVKKRGRETVVMPAKPTKRAKGSVGEGEAGKKAKVTHHPGGQCVSEKS